MIRKSRRFLKALSGGIATAAAASLLLAGGTARAADWKPSQPVLYTIPAGPGGSLDQSVRMIKHIAEKRGLIDKPFLIENKPGGAGKIAVAPLDQHPRDPNFLTVITYSLLTSHIIGAIDFTYTDYQPIAMLFGEYVTLSVRDESPIKDVRDLVERLRKDPASLSIGIATSLGNHIHVGAAKPLKAAGVDISKLVVVPFRSSAESLTNLMGGHIDVMAATTPNVITQMKQGRIRVLAVASAERLKGDLASVPTWRESGVDATYNSAQGVMAPKGIPPEALAYWTNLFRTVTQDPEWLAFVESRQWDPRFIDSSKVGAELKQAYDESRDVLVDLGLSKR
ncbi:MAG: tripartite tricarboxylate transporter substrate binding protein [Lautropia sp.]